MSSKKLSLEWNGFFFVLFISDGFWGFFFIFDWVRKNKITTKKLWIDSKTNYVQRMTYYGVHLNLRIEFWMPHRRAICVVDPQNFQFQQYRRQKSRKWKQCVHYYVHSSIERHLMILALIFFFSYHFCCFFVLFIFSRLHFVISYSYMSCKLIL